MRALAQFVAASRTQAVAVTTAFVAAAALLPPLVWFAGAAVALVTLLQGWREGLGVAVMGAGVAGLLAWLPMGGPLPLLVLGLSAALPVWLLAAMLAASGSLATALQAAALLALAVLTGLVWMLPDAQATWGEILRRFLHDFYVQRDLPMEQFDALVDRLATLMNGMVAASLMFSSAVGLLLGRWWQSLVVHPGGFGEEFRGLRFDRQTAVIAGLLLAGALALPGAWLDGAALVAVTLFLFAGLALVHGLVRQRGMAGGWLVGTYALMVLALPQMTLLLASFGWLDSFVDFRRQLGGDQGPGEGD